MDGTKGLPSRTDVGREIRVRSQMLAFSSYRTRKARKKS